MIETVGGQVVADWIGLTARRVQQLADEGVIPKVGRGAYPLMESVQAYCKFMRGQGGADEENGVGDLASERAALAKAQRERTELQNAVLRKELIPTDAAVKIMQTLAVAMKTRLLSLPDVVKQRHPDVSLVARDEMAGLIEDALRQVAISGLPFEYRVSGEADGTDPDAAGETDVESVG